MKRKMTTDRYFFFDSFFFDSDFLMCDERAELSSSVFLLFFFSSSSSVYGIFGRREGETEKKNLRKNETKRHNCVVIDCDTKNTQCFGGGRRKKKKNNNNQKRRKSVARVQRRKNREISAWENSARRTRDARN